MFKTFKIFVLIIFLIAPISTKAHVQHYENLNRIEFDIYRNNKNIGKHIFTFKKTDENIAVESEIKFEIKKLGVVLYKYVNLYSEDDDLVIDGSSFKGKVSNEFLLGTWWNHSIVKASAQISAVSGRIIKQKVTFLGKENIEINGKLYKTLHFNFSSTDKSLKKDKKLNTDVWYEEETLNWVKASFKKKGNWEYKLISLN